MWSKQTRAYNSRRLACVCVATPNAWRAKSWHPVQACTDESLLPASPRAHLVCRAPRFSLIRILIRVSGPAFFSFQNSWNYRKPLCFTHQNGCVSCRGNPRKPSETPGNPSEPPLIPLRKPPGNPPCCEADCPICSWHGRPCSAKQGRLI